MLIVYKHNTIVHLQNKRSEKTNPNFVATIITNNQLITKLTD